MNISSDIQIPVLARSIYDTGFKKPKTPLPVGSVPLAAASTPSLEQALLHAGKRQLHPNRDQHRPHGPIEPMPHPRKPGAYTLLAEQHRHQAEPQRRGHR